MLCRFSLILIIFASSINAQEQQPAVEEKQVSQESQPPSAPGNLRTLSTVIKAELGDLKDPGEKVRNSFDSGMIILHDGEFYTVVPMGSILRLPEEYQKHIIARPAGRFIVWPKFLARNSEWLAGEEVSLAMAKGDGEAAKETLQRVEKSPRAVVAVYKTNPITVLQPVVTGEVSVAESKE